MPMPQINTYSTADDAEWIGHFGPFGKFPVMFTAKSKVNLYEKMETFWVKEQARNANPAENYAPQVVFTPPKVIKPPATLPVGGRGSGGTGRIWVINRKTRDRKRIDPTDLDNFLSLGYVQGKKF
jgi:hypothetical protein